MIKTENNTKIMPLLPLRNMAVFPYMILHFDVIRDRSIKAIEAAMESDQQIFLVAQSDLSVNEPKQENLYPYGTVSVIKQMLKLPSGGLRVLVEGIDRAKLSAFKSDEGYVLSEVMPHQPKKAQKTKELSALVRTAKDLFDQYMQINPNVPTERAISVINVSDAGVLSDIIAANSLFQIEDKQQILGELSVKKRIQATIKILEKEIELITIENDVLENVRGSIEKDQRDYFIRAQIKALKNEIGEGNQDTEQYTKRIEESRIDEKHQKKLLKEVEKLANTSPNSPDSGLIKNYLDTVLDLPWTEKSEETIDLKMAEKILNRDHYGLKEVKERILEYLAVRKLKTDRKGNVLCLAGPPGVGKTSIVKSIAEAMNRKYVRISLGGVRDESDIRGHRKTYIGAMPGRIINAIKTAGTKNPIILLDEVDKLGHDFRGDPSSALLEALDTEQNNSFVDHYIEIPFDLSDVIFITTANSLEPVQRPLLDRMEVISLSSYTSEEKLEIAYRYLVPKQKKLNGIPEKKLMIQRPAIRSVIAYYTRESGVRNLERALARICRKSAREFVAHPDRVITVTAANLIRYLGKYKFKQQELPKEPQVGIVNGLAWTPVGGDTLQIEANVLDGSGKLMLTGKLGDVMQESAKAAVTFVRSVAKELSVDSKFYKTKDIHIHVPDGATPKDGPSAGITITTALVSALSGIPVRGDIAMTGEVTIRGRVLPIGGLKEKTLAAFQNGIKDIIIPTDNDADIEDIPEEIRKQLTFYPVSNVMDVLKLALLKA